MGYMHGGVCVPKMICGGFYNPVGDEKLDGKKKCIFCEEYRAHKSVNDFKRNHPEWYGDDAWLQYEIKVAMVIRHWRPGYKRQASRTTDYRSQGCGYAINFCPECGKALKEKKREFRDWQRNIAVEKADAYFAGYEQALFDVQSMLHCSNYEKRG